MCGTLGMMKSLDLIVDREKKIMYNSGQSGKE